MGGLEHASLANTIFFSIKEVKTRSRAILTCCFKIDCKKTRINYLPIVYCGKDKHIP
jgi:hypothetical protein